MSFQFEQPMNKKPSKQVSLLMDNDLFDRLNLACKKLSIETKKGSKKSKQELIRQMIDHCLTEMGV